MRKLMARLIALLFTLVMCDAPGRAQSGGGYLGANIRAETHSSQPVIEQVSAGSPAAVAGLRPGDAIISIGGQTVTSTADAARMIGEKPPGSRVDLVVLRSNARQRVTVTLATRPAIPPTPTSVTPPVAQAQTSARPIPALRAVEFQPVAPATNEGDVFVAGTNKRWRVHPYTLYHSPYEDGPNWMHMYPGSNAPALSNFGVPGYSGHLISKRNVLIVFRQPEPLPITRGLYWRPGLNSALLGIDGYQFRDQAALEHYLMRQPPGRVVEYLFTQPNRAGRHVALVYYAPLLAWNRQVRQEFQDTANDAYARDMAEARSQAGTNAMGALFAGAIGFAAMAAASAPPDPDPFNCQARRQYQRESGGIIVAC